MGGRPAGAGHAALADSARGGGATGAGTPAGSLATLAGRDAGGTGRGAAAAADGARGAASGLGLLGVLPPLARAALALPHPFTPHDGTARLTVLVAQARRAERRPTAAARDLPAVVGPSG